MNLLKLSGDWLRGSGWTSALLEVEITSSGCADSILSGSHVTRTRYAHQVTVFCFHILQERANQQSSLHATDGHNDLSIEEWCTILNEEKPQFKFWATTLQPKFTILQFVRSIREKYFKMYVQSLVQIALWLCALDHTNYCRWFSVHSSEIVN